MAANQGFASLTKERRRMVAKAGAEAAKLKGTKHKWSSDKAKAASAKGVKVRREKQYKNAIGKLVLLGFDPEIVKKLSMDEAFLFARNPKKLEEKLSAIVHPPKE